MKQRCAALATLLPSLLLALSAGCREPTEIFLDVRTNVSCTAKGAWRGVAIYAGKTGVDERDQAPVLVTSDCDAKGHIGNLVITPSGAKDELLSLRVVAATGKDSDVQPEDCAAADYRGCIVARRAVRFGPHERLDINVELTHDCIDQACDPERTCSTGSCVDVKIESEAAPSMPTPGTPAPSEHTVRCGDNGVTCGTSGAVCCLSVDVPGQKTSGRCLQPQDCPPGDIVLNCDDDTDCSAKDSAAGPGLCLLSWTQAGAGSFVPATISESQCLGPEHQFETAATVLAMCQTRQPCQNRNVECIASKGTTDTAPFDNQLPGYFWCVVTKGQ